MFEKFKRRPSCLGAGLEPSGAAGGESAFGVDGLENDLSLHGIVHRPKTQEVLVVAVHRLERGTVHHDVDPLLVRLALTALVLEETPVVVHVRRQVVLRDERGADHPAPGLGAFATSS